MLNIWTLIGFSDSTDTGTDEDTDYYDEEP